MLGMILILAVMQDPPPPPADIPGWQNRWLKEQEQIKAEERAAELRVADVEFAMAVEESVMSIPGTAPPEPYKGLIRRLGAHCYRCREIASKKLLAASGGDHRWLLWGRKDADLEVRLRCNNLLKKLVKCPQCGGAGKTRQGRWNDRNDGWTDECSLCVGKGTSWKWSIWD
jgi:hypothetical protein